MTTSGYRDCFGGDENVLESDSGDDASLANMLKTTNHTSK